MTPPLPSQSDTAVVERSVAKKHRTWHICASDHPAGSCTPGCVAYCGKEYTAGTSSRTSDGVPRIEICILCQGFKELES